MRKKRSRPHLHHDRAAEQERAERYPMLLALCKGRGMRTLEDFSPDELEVIRARAETRRAGGTWTGEAS